VVALSIVFGLESSVHGFNRIVDDLNAILVLANKFSEGGNMVYMSGTDIVDVMVASASSDCPAVQPLIEPFNTTFTQVSTEFLTNTAKFPKTISSVLDTASGAKQGVEIVMIIPILLVVFVSAIGALAVIINSAKMSRWVQVLMFICLLTSGLVVGGEIMLSVVGSDFCVDANDNAINLIDDLIGNTTASALRYAINCTGEFSMTAPLKRGQYIVSDLMIQVQSFDPDSCEMDPIMERIQISFIVMDQILQQHVCPVLNSRWNNLLHKGACDEIVPGLGWHWMVHIACLILLLGGVGAAHVVATSFRHSVVFKNTEATPLFGSIGRSDAGVVPYTTVVVSKM